MYCSMTYKLRKPSQQTYKAAQQNKKRGSYCIPGEKHMFLKNFYNEHKLYY